MHGLIQNLCQCMDWYRISVSAWFDMESLSVHAFIHNLYQCMVWYGISVSACLDTESLSVHGLIRNLCQCMAWYRISVSAWLDTESLSVHGLIQNLCQCMVWYHLNWRRKTLGSQLGCPVSPVSFHHSLSKKWNSLHILYWTKWRFLTKILSGFASLRFHCSQ